MNEETKQAQLGPPPSKEKIIAFLSLARFLAAESLGAEPFSPMGITMTAAADALDWAIGCRCSQAVNWETLMLDMAAVVDSSGRALINEKGVKIDLAAAMAGKQ